jgi:hypothetical protein
MAVKDKIIKTKDYMGIQKPVKHIAEGDCSFKDIQVRSKC